MAEQAGVSSSAHRNSIARKKKKKKESLQLCFLCAPTVNLSKSFALAKQQPWWWWPWDKHPHQQHCWHADFTGLAVEHTQVSCLCGVQFIKLVACSQGQFFPKLSARLLLVATATEVLVIAHRNPLGIAQTNKKNHQAGHLHAEHPVPAHRALSICKAAFKSTHCHRHNKVLLCSCGLPPSDSITAGSRHPCLRGGCPTTIRHL